MNLLIENVSKKYSSGTWGLKEFSLDIGPGVLGLLGPNGAGKSTLMRIVATISRPTEGRVLWDGADVHRSSDALRSSLGYLPQDFGVYPNLSPVEFLDYIAAAKGLDGANARKRIEELLLLVNLVDVRNKPLGGFSGGMKQRVGIAQALLNDPRILIVDEPTGGLDPEERVRFRNLLSELSGERIIILSTHIVSDIEATATHIAVVKEGKLVRHDSPEGMLRRAEGKVWEWIVAASELPRVKEQHRISSTQRRSDGVRVRVVTDNPPPGSTAAQPNLEDAYLLDVAPAIPSMAA